MEKYKNVPLKINRSRLKSNWSPLSSYFKNHMLTVEVERNRAQYSSFFSTSKDITVEEDAIDELRDTFSKNQTDPRSDPLKFCPN